MYEVSILAGTKLTREFLWNAFDNEDAFCCFQGHAIIHLNGAYPVSLVYSNDDRSVPHQLQITFDLFPGPRGNLSWVALGISILFAVKAVGIFNLRNMSVCTDSLLFSRLFLLHSCCSCKNLAFKINCQYSAKSPNSLRRKALLQRVALRLIRIQCNQGSAIEQILGG